MVYELTKMVLVSWARSVSPFGFPQLRKAAAETTRALSADGNFFRSDAPDEIRRCGLNMRGFITCCGSDAGLFAI